MRHMKISRKGREFIKEYESFIPWVYDDHKPAVLGKYKEWHGEKVIGTLTIGFGHTNAAFHPLRIKQGLRITLKQANQIFAVDMLEVEYGVNHRLKVKITQGQFDALCSLCFNVGLHGARGVFTLLNKGKYEAAGKSFLKYVMSKGRKLRGLVKRRKAEQRLWNL
jgi:lysozyme